LKSYKAVNSRGRGYGDDRQFLGFQIENTNHRWSVRKDSFDLVLMVFRKPEMNWLGATWLIHALFSYASEVPFINLPADAMAKNRKKNLTASMERCDTKPIDFRGLISAINDVVGRPIHDMVTVLDDTSSAGRGETSLLQFGIDANVNEFLWEIPRVTNFSHR